MCLLLDHEGYKGIIPKRQTLARVLRCNLNTVDLSLRRCANDGVAGRKWKILTAVQ